MAYKLYLTNLDTNKKTVEIKDSEEKVIERIFTILNLDNANINIDKLTKDDEELTIETTVVLKSQILPKIREPINDRPI